MHVVRPDRLNDITLRPFPSPGNVVDDTFAERKLYGLG